MEPWSGLSKENWSAKGDPYQSGDANEQQRGRHQESDGDDDVERPFPPRSSRQTRPKRGSSCSQIASSFAVLPKHET
jgi:hypothetical protein